MNLAVEHKQNTNHKTISIYYEYTYELRSAEIDASDSNRFLCNLCVWCVFYFFLLLFCVAFNLRSVGTCGVLDRQEFHASDLQGMTHGTLYMIHTYAHTYAMHICSKGTL